MSSFDNKIKSVLVRKVPLPTDLGHDWEGLLTRADVSARPAHTRRLLYSLAFAALAAIVLAATPLGAVIARGFGDFSDWLNGTPGQPISKAEQKTIEREESRELRNHWVSFPQGTKFRRLIVTKVDGVEYKLYGYRAGDMFCLRLSTSSETVPIVSCAPKTELTLRKKPVLALFVDASIFNNGKTGLLTPFMRKSTVTFGIASDGVTVVRGLTRSSKLPGLVAGNSFLIVNRRNDVIDPKSRSSETWIIRNRVRSIVAGDAGGDVVKVRVAGGLGGIEGRTGALMAPVSGPGFRMAKQKIAGVKIGWLDRREPRGTALSQRFWWSYTLPPQCGLECAVLAGAHEIVYSRLITPDSGGGLRIGVSRHRDGETCIALVYPQEKKAWSQSCMSKKDLSSGSWSEANTYRFTTGTGIREGAQYSIQAGLVDDHVRRMTLLLVSGKQIPVRIKDNAYVFLLAETDYPVRLVAFNSANRVVNVERLG